MFPCSGCHRHIAPAKNQSDSKCPFCGTVQRDVSAPLAFAGLLLGLSLMGCGDKNGGDEAAEDTTDPTVTASSEDTGASSGVSGTESTTQNNSESAEASDYAGPEPTEDTAEPESSGEDTTGPNTTDDSTGPDPTEDTTGDTSASSDTSGTDTGNMMTDASGEGSDYGGAPPPDQPL